MHDAVRRSDRLIQLLLATPRNRHLNAFFGVKVDAPGKRARRTERLAGAVTAASEVRQPPRYDYDLRRASERWVLLSPAENSCIHQNRDKGGGQSGVVNIVPNETRVHRYLGKDKRKFTDLCESDTNTQRCLRGIAEQPNYREPNRKLADKN